MTNGDRIRAMTDEEIAERIDMCPPVWGETGECPHKWESDDKCLTCWLEWLKREADDDDWEEL